MLANVQAFYYDMTLISDDSNTSEIRLVKFIGILEVVVRTALPQHAVLCSFPRS
jgi:hypothetical protein